MSRWQDAERTWTESCETGGAEKSDPPDAVFVLPPPVGYMDLFPADKRLADLIEFASNIGSRRTYEEW